jgi:outer membrane protein assembly factor BamB
MPQSDPINRFGWEQSRHDNFNTGFNNITTSISNDTIWSTNLDNGKIDPAVVVSGPHIYVVTEGIYNWTSYSYDKSPKVFCLNQGGAVVWSQNITGGGYQLASALVIGDQLIVPSTDGKVFSFNALNGSRQWTYSVPFSWTGITSSPIDYRDQIIIASGDGNVTALALNGTKLWNTKIASSVYFSSPAAKDGIIYIGSEDSKLHAVYANGSGEAWNVTVPGKVRSSPLLLDDKIVITYAVYNGMVAIDGGVAAYNYTGAQIWNVNINSTSTSAAWTSKGLVVTNITGVSMISPNGTVLWTKNLGVVKSSPSVSRSGIYLVTYGTPAVAYMLDLNGNILFKEILVPAAYAMSSPAIADGRVYFASDSGYVYCIQNIPPICSFESTKDSLKVMFMVTVSSNESYTVTWDFGDGNRSVGPTCDHTYSKPGDYNVTTWIVDSQGGNTTKLQVVSVSEAASTTDNTMLYAIVAVIAIAVVAVIAVVFVRGRKK